MKSMDNRAIGVFDSGVGGLTVVAGIRKVLPNESIVYVGDTARVPYGTRSKETITTFALEIAEALLEKDVKALVIACNTITAVALPEIQELAKDKPVIGVIQPTSEEAVSESKRKKIGVIATPATIKSEAYQKMIKSIDGNVEVLAKAAPLLVPIIEEGLFNHQVASIMVAEYLKEMKGLVDTVILGCTHYPLIKAGVKEFMGENVEVIDSALPTARELKIQLEKRDLLSEGSQPVVVYFTSDDPKKSQDIAKAFLGEELELRKLSL